MIATSCSLLGLSPERFQFTREVLQTLNPMYFNYTATAHSGDHFLKYRNLPSSHLLRKDIQNHFNVMSESMLCLNCMYKQDQKCFEANVYRLN